MNRLVLLLCGLALLVPSSSLAKGKGAVTLDLRDGTHLVLPVAGGTIGRTAATLRTAGPLKVGAKRWTAVRVELDLVKLRITGVRGGKRAVVFTSPTQAYLNSAGQSVTLAQSPLRTVAGRSAGTLHIAAHLPIPEPAVPARPAGAVDLTGATMTWHVRDSFVRYMNAGEGITPSRGVTAEPPATTPESSTPLVYEFHFPFRDGWRDPATGRAYVRFSGRVTFSYKGHGIDFDVNDFEIDLSDDTPNAVARFTGRADTRPGNRRGVLIDLDASNGLTQMPGSIPEDAAGAIFAGYYLAGDPFGWVTLELPSR